MIYWILLRRWNWAKLNGKTVTELILGIFNVRTSKKKRAEECDSLLSP